MAMPTKMILLLLGQIYHGRRAAMLVAAPAVVRALVLVPLDDGEIPAQVFDEIPAQVFDVRHLPGNVGLGLGGMLEQCVSIQYAY